MRNAIDLHESKRQHSAFWYRLQELNDKIHVFRSFFYTREAKFNQAFLRKKKEEIELRKRLEKEKMEEAKLELKKIKRKVQFKNE